ncbi:MAG TPA: dUTP diphosphatase [Syntrophales bacterium]|nr:dUTP diphosphatase [Syntrophales bacterium]
MMEEIAIPIQNLSDCDDVSFPRYMTEYSAGMDIFAAVEADETILPGQRKMIPTGIAIALPIGYEAEIRPRSGLAVKNGVTLVNSPGTIDADYRGEIGIIMINHGEKPFVIRRGDRIAQMIVHRVCKVSWIACQQLDQTSRGNGGFGHTE